MAGALLLAACNSADGSGTASSPTTAVTVDDSEPATPRQRLRYPPAPPAPDAKAQSATDALDAVATIKLWLGAAELDTAAVQALGDTGDIRYGWYLSDVLDFFPGDDGVVIVDAFEQLRGVSIANDPESESSPFRSLRNHLVAWDAPDYPEYQQNKRELFILLEPAWEPFFGDEHAYLDWRHVSWGGVYIDDRELGDPERCRPRGCIPSLDDSATTDAAGGTWYPDNRIVFGLVEGDEALAFPKNIAETHEMFNFTLDGRRFGLPYCTLCGSAQAYYADNSGAAAQPVLRTTGLLSRSNKVM